MTSSRILLGFALLGLPAYFFGQSPTGPHSTAADLDEIAALWEETETPEREIQLRLGYQYSKGDYGSAVDTTTSSWAATLAYDWSQWSLDATVPHLRVEGSSEVTVTSGILRRRQTRTTTVKTSESGLGDITLGVTRLLGPVLGPVEIDLSARVKLPTASESKGLGTGETDYLAQADFYYSLEPAVLFATTGYRVLGDNAQLPLENAFFTSAGLLLRLNAATRAGVSLDWQQRTQRGEDAALEATLFVSRRLGDGWSASAYALTGFSDASPDFGFGGSVGYRF
jgi:hypothetical protein